MGLEAMASIRIIFTNERLGLLVFEEEHMPFILIYKQWLVNEGGLNMRVPYPLNLLPNKNKPRSNISRAASV